MCLPNNFSMRRAIISSHEICFFQDDRNWNEKFPGNISHERDGTGGMLDFH
jgi:hypothetical protein